MKIISKREYELYNIIQQFRFKNLYIEEEVEEYKYEENYNNKYKKINNMHDKLFRDLLNKNDEMKEFLNKYFKIKIQENDLEKYNSNFITNYYQDKQSDIIYKIKNKNIFFLIEHQSSADKTIPIRLMEYSIEIIRSQIENIKLYKNKFPKVIPIVLYTGNAKWKIENQYKKLESYIGYNEVKELGIDLKYNLIDVNNLNLEELFKDKSLVSKAIIIEKCKTRDEMKKYLKKIVINIDNNQKEKMEQIILYMLRQMLEKEDIEEILKELYKSKEREEKSMNLLTANLIKEKEAWKRQAIKEGKKEGIKEGIKEGKEEEKRTIAQKMKEKGIEIKLISSITGLKVEEI